MARSATGNLNHLGVEQAIRRSGLSYQNEHRDWRFFEALYYSLFQKLAQPDKTTRNLLPKRAIHIMDTTTVDLRLAEFNRAHFCQYEGAVKLHTLMDLEECLPLFVETTHGKVHETTAAKGWFFQKDAVLVGAGVYGL